LQADIRSVVQKT